MIFPSDRFFDNEWRKALYHWPVRGRHYLIPLRLMKEVISESAKDDHQALRIARVLLMHLGSRRQLRQAQRSVRAHLRRKYRLDPVIFDKRFGFHEYTGEDAQGFAYGFIHFFGWQTDRAKITAYYEDATGSEILGVESYPPRPRCLRKLRRRPPANDGFSIRRQDIQAIVGRVESFTIVTGTFEHRFSATLGLSHLPRRFT